MSAQDISVRIKFMDGREKVIQVDPQATIAELAAKVRWLYRVIVSHLLLFD
jgi:hypothetical protein